jgi:hypothetical protein
MSLADLQQVILRFGTLLHAVISTFRVTLRSKAVSLDDITYGLLVDKDSSAARSSHYIVVEDEFFRGNVAAYVHIQA